MKTLKVRLPVVDAAEADELLSMVTQIDGVVAALLDAASATLEVVLSRSATALLVREQLVDAFAAGHPTA